MKRTASIVLAAALALAWTSLVMGQTTKPSAAKLGEGRGQVTLTWDEFVKITGYDPSAKGSQSLTVPWTEVEELLGVKVANVGAGATVDLPWKEFRSLLEWSIKNKGEKLETPPPADFLVASSQYTGVLSGDGAEFTLKVKIDILRKNGWKRIPLLTSAVAIKKSTLPEGYYLNTAGETYELLTEKTGSAEVTLEFVVAAGKQAGINRVSFPRLLAGSSVLDLTVADNADVKVAGAQSCVTKSADGKTGAIAAIPGSVPVDVTWEKALPKLAAAPTKMYADTRTLAAVAEGALLCQETVAYNILHTGVREVKLQTPAGINVLEVSGPGVQDWRADDSGRGLTTSQSTTQPADPDKKGQMTVTLRSETIGPLLLRIAYEKAGEDDVEVPIIRPLGVERERGFIGVVALANVEVAAGKLDGATSIDVRQLPADITAMTNQPTLLAFRYLGEKCAIPLTVKKHGEVNVLLTIVDSGLLTGMQLGDGRRMTKAVLSVRNNRNQFLRVKMPAGSELWSASVGGNPVTPAKDDKDNVLIPLVRSAAGQRELASFPVELAYIETPDAAAPASGKLKVELPALDCPAMQIMYSLYAPEEGEYTIADGLFGTRNGFSGSMRLVDTFTSLSAGPTAEAVKTDSAKQVEQLQQQVDAKMDAQAKAAGPTPIHVQLPVKGKLFRLEKILVLPKDQLFFEVQYRNWRGAQ